MAVGYATLYGDMVGGFAVLKDVFKTDVFRLSALSQRACRARAHPRDDDRAAAERRAARRSARRPVAAAIRPARPRAGGVRRARSLARRAAGGVRCRDGREGARARRPGRVQAPPGAARREAPAARLRPRLAAPDREALAGCTATPRERRCTTCAGGPARARGHPACTNRLRRRRRSAPPAGRRAGAPDELGQPARARRSRPPRSSSGCVHHRSSNTYSALSCCPRELRAGVKAGTRTRWYCSRWPSHWPPMNGITCRRVQTTGPISGPRQSRLLLELAADRILGRLAGLDPSARRRPQRRPGNSKRTSRIRSSGSITTARAAGRIRSSLTARESCSALNQRNRSSQGTAAFAGEVDGSTKSAVSPSAPLLQAVRRPLAERAPVGLLADECDHAGSKLVGEPSRAARRCPRSRAREGRPSRGSSDRPHS